MCEITKNDSQCAKLLVHELIAKLVTNLATLICAVLFSVAYCVIVIDSEGTRHPVIAVSLSVA